MVKIISISVSDEHKKILDDMELSPSGLFKQRMEQLKQESEIYNQKLEQLQAAIGAYGKLVNEKNTEIETLQGLLRKNGIIF